MSVGERALARTGTLAAHGLSVGPDGYDLGALTRLLDQRGLRWATEPVSLSGTRRRRWRATVFAARPGGGKVGCLWGARGHGASEAEALATALAAMLRAAAERGHDPPR